MGKYCYYSRSEKGFYLEDQNKPNDAVRITANERDYLLEMESAGKLLHKSFDDRGVTVPIDEPLITLEKLATQKLHSINTQADALLEPISNQYPRSEVLSWDKQEIEARRWQEWSDTDQGEPEPPTLYIDNILITRTDVDKPELVRRIITKADAYTTTGQITGIRHNLEKQVEDILADDTLTDDEKRAAIEAIDEEKAYSVVNL